MILPLAAPGPAPAATPAVQNSTGTALVVRPLSITKVQDMDFGVLLAPAAGTAILEPNADTFATTGGLIKGGGTPQCAEFAGAAQGGAVVIIRIPNGPITLTRVGGTQTMTLNNFTLQGQSKRALAKATSFTFRVGGTLNVAANQAEGTYVGTFDVSIQYP